MKLSLEKNDRICFLGDSITANGLWISEIFEHFITEKKDLKIGFYNCGVGGSKGYEVELRNRLYCDCFNLFPKYVVVMFGMNDIAPPLYSPLCKEEKKEEKREKLLSQYENTIENIVSLCKAEDITPILCSPTSYDEYNDYKQENWCADKALLNCRDTVEKIAERHNLIFIDMSSPLKKYMSKKPISEDRVHPNEYGQHLMAETFLKEIGEKEKFEEDKKCIFSDKNKERFELENSIRMVVWVERDYMGWQYEESLPTVEERKIKALKKSQNDERTWIKDIIDNYYIKYVDSIEELKGKLIKITRQIYD